MCSTFRKMRIQMLKFDISQRCFFKVSTKHLSFKTVSLQFLTVFQTFGHIFSDIYEFQKIGERAFRAEEKKVGVILRNFPDKSPWKHHKVSNFLIFQVILFYEYVYLTVKNSKMFYLFAII